MTADNKPRLRFEDFRHVRLFQRMNRALQVILSVSLVILLNYIAAMHFIRKDMTASHKYSLSPETRQYIRELEQTVTIYVTIPKNSSEEGDKIIFKDIENLLYEYEYMSMRQGKPMISVEYIDIFRERKKADQLASQYGLTQANAILVVSGENRRVVSGTDLYVTEQGKVTEFKGEQVFTSAILDVADQERQKVYFIVGHGEMRPDSVDPLRGLSQLTTFLRERNIDAQAWDLSIVPQVPDDADLLIIASPQTPLLPKEEDILRHYMGDRNGRILVFLDPKYKHGLDNLFYDWGILAQDMVVLDKGPDMQSEYGDLIIRHFGRHPITEYLLDNQMPVYLGLSQVVRPDPGAPIDDRRSTKRILTSSAEDPESGKVTSWAERDWRSGKTLAYDPETDLNGPVCIVTLSQRSVGEGLGLNIPGGRIVVFGNAGIISNDYFGYYGNSILINNTINWALDRHSQLNIPPRQLKNYRLTLSKDNLIHIGIGISLAPVVVGFLGIMILIIRRR